MKEGNVAQGKPEKDEQVAPTFSWLDLGMEIFKALATSEEEQTASPSDDSQPAPTEDRVLARYVAYNGQMLTALVIGYERNRADLAVFTNMKNAAGKKNFGLQFHQDVTYSEMKLPGTWHWL
jgi:hypothetical protein